MSNKRRTAPPIIPPPPAPEFGPASLTRNPNGTLTVVWPEGRPKATGVTSASLEGLVDALNTAVLAAQPPRRRWWHRIVGGA